ncbi:MAG TPA: hypothetical protein VEH06_08685, partial [Candidatus Bathyarchaeia archaeon]|nr:hypothetical protein [Candidatus Bathyarchaeia archaeon]
YASIMELVIDIRKSCRSAADGDCYCGGIIIDATSRRHGGSRKRWNSIVFDRGGMRKKRN